MTDNRREVLFLDYWEEIGRELLKHPRLEDSIEGLVGSGELICEGTEFIPALEAVLLLVKWLTWVLGVTTTFRYDKRALAQKLRDDDDRIFGKGAGLVGDLFKGVEGIEDV